MRLMLLIWIQANKDEELLEGTTIEQYVQMDGQSMRTYTDRMRQMGEWFDTLMLLAASAVFEVQIVCLSPEPHLICNPAMMGQPHLLVCSIANICNSHFGR